LSDIRGLRRTAALERVLECSLNAAAGKEFLYDVSGARPERR
jgi:hypothetical protein